MATIVNMHEAKSTLSKLVEKGAEGGEVAIKRAQGNLDVEPADLLREIENEGFSALHVTYDHAIAAGALPPHHKDPFDRMLIAQAQLESLTIVTSDREFAAYGVALLPA